MDDVRTTKRLTEFSHGAGCGCKIGPDELADVLGRLAPTRHPDLLVGTDTGDDAAVWRLDADRALVVTTDFFTPLVDDPRTWGRIAATNAASDVYAMGGRPLLALNLVAWPVDVLGPEVLAEVLAGGADAAAAGGWLAVGGHSIDDPEPKYGQAVVGEVHPDRIMTNAALSEGDVVVLTKALGTGAITTAVKFERSEPDWVAAAIDSMCTLNDTAAHAAAGARVAAATDVTGFGLLGHLKKMAAASGVDVELRAADVPALPGAREALADGMVSGGTRRNAAWAADVTTFADDVDEVDRWLLADAQTSGGLLLGVAPDRVGGLLDALVDAGLPAAAIGTAVEEGPGRIAVA
ncbi:selenide, water dikinase SelD [Euzebya sp.]|uniref:selenide, water dikinase SelD n=1 Tax=Euzebya sp. TaxID=1971409 RepID=UPI0035130CAF